MTHYEKIKSLQKEIRKIRQLIKDEESLIQTSRQASRESKKKARHEIYLECLKLAAGGMSVSEIAKTKNVSKHSLRWRMQMAWLDEFPNDYSSEQIYHYGFLTSLRADPPPFK
jgi:DNA invertase Pin-like site-specific DNA recombinase